MNNTQVGRALRDAGAISALENAGEDWHDMAVSLTLKYFGEAGWEGALFEDAREYATKCGIGAPPSPNAWGAVALALSKRNLITRTGAMLPSKAVRSHARAQPVWRLAKIQKEEA